MNKGGGILSHIKDANTLYEGWKWRGKPAAWWKIRKEHCSDGGIYRPLAHKHHLDDFFPEYLKELPKAQDWTLKNIF